MLLVDGESFPTTCRNAAVSCRVVNTLIQLVGHHTYRVFAPFWSQNEYTLCPFLSGIGYGFQRTTGLYERSIVSIPNEYEKKKDMRIRNGFEELFCLRSNLSNDNLISV